MSAPTPRAKNLALQVGGALGLGILAAVLISSRDSHQHSQAARTDGARGDAAAVRVVAG